MMGKTTRLKCRLQTKLETERAAGDRSLMRHLKSQEAGFRETVPYFKEAGSDWR